MRAPWDTSSNYTPLNLTPCLQDLLCDQEAQVNSAEWIPFQLCQFSEQEIQFVQD